MTYTVWYYSNESLGSIQESEGPFTSFEEACKWFKHHTTNVCANVGWTVRVIIVDNSDDAILAEWQFTKGIVYPKEDVE